MQVYSVASWFCCLLQTPQRFEQAAQAVLHGGIQQIDACYLSICQTRSSHIVQESSILLAMRLHTPGFVMQGAESTTQTGPCARDRWQQDKDMHFLIPKQPGDGKGHLGCAPCTLLSAACPPGEYLLECRQTVYAVLMVVYASPWLTTLSLEPKHTSHGQSTCVLCSAGCSWEYALGGPWLQHLVSAIAWFLRHESGHATSSVLARGLAWQLWGWLHW